MYIENDFEVKPEDRRMEAVDSVHKLYPLDYKTAVVTQ